MRAAIFTLEVEPTIKELPISRSFADGNSVLSRYSEYYFVFLQQYSYSSIQAHKVLLATSQP